MGLALGRHAEQRAQSTIQDEVLDAVREDGMLVPALASIK